MQFSVRALSLLLWAASTVIAQLDIELNARQEDGEKFQCHANCGYAILDASLDGNCENSTWLDLYEGCLGCAVQFEIWENYSDGVNMAGEACGLETVPGQDDAEEQPASPTPTTFPPVEESPTDTTTAEDETPAPAGDGDGADEEAQEEPSNSAVTSVGTSMFLLMGNIAGFLLAVM